MKRLVTSWIWMEQSLCQCIFLWSEFFILHILVCEFVSRHFLSTTTIPVCTVIPFAAVSRVLWLFQVAKFWCPGFNNHFCRYKLTYFSPCFQIILFSNFSWTGFFEHTGLNYSLSLRIWPRNSAAFQMILVMLTTGCFFQQMILTQSLCSLVLKLCLVC